MGFNRKWAAWVAIGLASALGGCAGENIEDSPQTGGAGMGGAGNGSGGAGNPTQARGASSVFPYTSGCGVGPYRIPADGTATNDRVVGDRITDGVGGDVDCSVTPSGSGYRVAVALEAGASAFSATATLESDADSSFSGTGRIGFYHPDAGNISSETCRFEVLASQEVGTGKVWGNFDCTQATKEATPGFTCNFEGSFVAEDCN